MTSGEHEIWARLRAAEHEASAARQLAAAAYEEVGSLAAGVRANTSLLNALRETQVEHGVRLIRLDSAVGGVETKVDGLDARLGGVEAKVDGLDARLGGVEAKVDGLDARLGGVEAKVDGLDARLGGVEAKVDGVDARLGGLESEVRTGFAMVGQGMATITALVERISPES